MIFVVAFGALAVGGVLILLIARYSPDAAAQRAAAHQRQERAAGATPAPPMPFEEWRRLVIDLLEALGFQIALEHAAGTDLELVARSTEPLRQAKYLVRAILCPPGDLVDQQTVLALQESARGEGAGKGILLTPYRIDRSGLDETEPSLELVDGAKLRALLSDHLPDRLAAIEPYRGF